MKNISTVKILHYNDLNCWFLLKMIAAYMQVSVSRLEKNIISLWTLHLEKKGHYKWGSQR